MKDLCKNFHFKQCCGCGNVIEIFKVGYSFKLNFVKYKQLYAFKIKIFKENQFKMRNIKQYNLDATSTRTFS